MAEQRPPRGRSPVVYPVVAVGMWLYAQAAFDVSVVGPRGPHPEPGTLYIAPHRAETDVPIICGSFYVASHSWSRAWPHLHFAARDDLFEPGFFAGFAAGASPRMRRRLYPLSVGGYMPWVQVRPIRSATSMKLMQAVALVSGDLPLAETLPEFIGGLTERALALDLPVPTTISDIRRGEFADLLWVTVDPGQLGREAFSDAWRRRAANATADLRSLIGLLQAGEPLLLFPEGRPSPDGGVGPIQRGLGALVRRGRPDRVRAFTIAYDTLAEGRQAVCVSAPDPVGPLGKDPEPELERYLARTLPATVSQALGWTVMELAEAGRESLQPAELSAALAAVADEARVSGRPLEPALADEEARLVRLDGALRTLASRGVLAKRSRSELALHVPAALSDPLLRRLVREHESATQAAIRT